MSDSLLKGKTFCLITGASRGIGRCIAETIAKVLPDNSVLLLLSRNVEQLEKVTNSIKSKNEKLSVSFDHFDQENLTHCTQGNIKDIFKKAGLNLDNYDTALIFHNAGTLGDLSKYSWEHLEEKPVEATINVNVTGPILLNAALMTELRKSSIATRVLVNISSLAAIQPMASHSLYCTVKAARDMYFQTVAKEDPLLRVLNWAPGPVDTDMQLQTRNCADPAMRQIFRDLHTKNQLLSCEASVGKLLAVLEKNEFESGQHIDYYDV